MKLALFPSPGGGFKTLQRSGQLSRLTEYYLPAYTRAFDEVLYFSYLDETLADYGSIRLDPRVHLIPNQNAQPYRLYTFTLARRQARWLSGCAVSRVFQATGIVPAWRAKRRWGIPIVITYGYRYAEFARAERRRLARAYTTCLEQLALRVADAIIVTTDELAGYVERFANPSRVHLIPNGIDLERFTPSATSPGAEKPSILFVGRLTRQKNLPCLLQAVADIQPVLPLRLDLVGDGPLRAALEQEAKDRRIEAHFHGTIPHEQVAIFYQQAAVFVLPSHLEGHPKALLEAMACGLPVIVSDVPGNRAMITHGTNGLTFATNATDVLARCIKTVLLKPNLAQKLGTQARQTIENRFNLDDLLQREIALLRRTALGVEA